MNSYKKLNEVKSKLQYYPVEINWTEIRPEEKINAYTYFDKNKNCHILVTPKIQCLFMHEFGHILFGHNKFSEQAIMLAEELIETKVTKYTKSIPNIFRRLRASTVQYFVNIAMDMEVNSKLFSIEEQELVGYEVSKAFKTKGRPMLAKDFGYPEKMNYIFYLQKMLEDPYFMQKIAEHERDPKLFEKMAEQQIKEILDGKIDSFPQGSFVPSISSTPEILRIFTRVLNNLYHNKKMPDGSHITENHNDNNNPGKSFSLNETNPESLEIKGKKFNSLEKAFSFLIPQIRKTTHSDMVYYMNRRKHGNSGIMISKRIENIIPVKPTVYILMDCSGSMDKKILDDVASTLRGIQLNADSKIIFWDSKLVKEIPYSKIKTLKEIPSGGGTHLASGLNYINSIKKIEDSVVVISDFYDNLKEIRETVINLHLRKHLMIGCCQPNEEIQNIKEFNTVIC